MAELIRWEVFLTASVNIIYNIWAECSELIKDRIPEPVANAWMDQLTPVAMGEGRFAVRASTDFARDMVSSRYKEAIESCLRAAARMDLSLEILSAGQQPSFLTAPEENAVQFPPDFDYTFQDFIVGSSNQLAYAASVAVAKNPGITYNPLFIYGPSGMGKTHLLHAISAEILKARPAFNVNYLKGDEFTNEFVESIQHGRMSEFRAKYRSVDLLLIDDVQFIANKEQTQEEFFHTFNTLYDMRKQIVLTSDRPPKEIAAIADRLRTRFEWGVIVDIGKPDFELRCAIIRSKAEKMQLDLPNEIVELIASRLKDNIRKLEGAVKKLKAFSVLAGQSITFDTTLSAIRDVISEEVSSAVSPQLIIDVVAEYYHVLSEDIRGSSRVANIAFARHMAMFLMREMSELSLPAIGSELGGRDHSTIINGIKRIEREIKDNPRIKLEANDLRKNILQARE